MRCLYSGQVVKLDVVWSPNREEVNICSDTVRKAAKCLDFLFGLITYQMNQQSVLLTWEKESVLTGIIQLNE